MMEQGEKKKRGRTAAPGRRDDILALFTELVARKGYENANFGEMAQVLGLSKGTIVHHFTNKQRMLIEVHERGLERRIAEMRAMLDRLDAPSEQLACFIRYAIGLYRYDHDANVVFIREIVTFRDDPDMEPVRALRRQWFAILESILHSGAVSGEFRALDAQMSARFIFGMTNWMWTWFDPEGSLTVEGAADQAIDLIMGGILSDAGGLRPLLSDDSKPAILVRETFAGA